VSHIIAVAGLILGLAAVFLAAQVHCPTCQGVLSPSEYDVTRHLQGDYEDEDSHDKNRHEQPGNPARVPYFLMRPQVWLVTHHVPLAERQPPNHRPMRTGGPSCSCPGRVLVAAGPAISGRQLAHDPLRRVLLPRSHVDAGPSCPQRGPQDSQTTWIKECRRQGHHRQAMVHIYRPAGPGRPYPHQRRRHRRAPGPGS
jgi:hypothetical protein